MAVDHSVFAPFYRVSYKKKPSGTRSVSYLSQWMSYWIDLRKAVRGRVRGEYYIRGEIREQFERIANSIEANTAIIKVGDEETAYLSKILQKQRISIPATITGEEELMDNRPPLLAFSGDMHSKIAGITDAIQRIETQIQTGGVEKKVAPEPSDREQSKADEENRVAWQDVLKGFQLYRDIFQAGMDNPKTQEGLYAALGEISKRDGISEKEALNKMDVALAIAKKFAGAG